MNKLLYAAALAVLTMTLSACNMVPGYRVWNSEQVGKAQLAQAQQNRQIRVLEAQAKLDSAKLTAQAEVEKAKGVAQANKIMIDSLGGAEGYLRWKYVEMLEENKPEQIIYLPTEAGLPILEAGRRSEKVAKTE